MWIYHLTLDYRGIGRSKPQSLKGFEANFIDWAALDLAENLLSDYPDLKCLFMSGYTANVIAHHDVLYEGVRFLQKPFSKKDLGRKLREVLES